MVADWKEYLEAEALWSCSLTLFRIENGPT